MARRPPRYAGAGEEPRAGPHLVRGSSRSERGPVVDQADTGARPCLRSRSQRRPLLPARVEPDQRESTEEGHHLAIGHGATRPTRPQPSALTGASARMVAAALAAVVAPFIIAARGRP